MLRTLRTHLDKADLDGKVAIRMVQEGGAVGESETFELLAFDDIGIAVRSGPLETTILLPWSRIHSVEIRASNGHQGRDAS